MTSNNILAICLMSEQERDKPHVQLLSYSKEEEHLYSPDGPTYFRPSYQQHTRFDIEQHAHRILNARFGRSTRIILCAPITNTQMTNYVGRRGDVLGPMWLEVRLPRLVSHSIDGWRNHVGHRLIRRMEFHIDRIPIDVWDDRMLDVHFELYETKQDGVRRMVHKYESDWTPETLGKEQEVSMFVPLPFRWGYDNHPFFPLHAIRDSELSVVLTFAPFHDLVRFDPDAQLPFQLVPRGPGVQVKLGRDVEPWSVYEDDSISEGELMTNLWVESYYLTPEERSIVSRANIDVLVETHELFEFTVSTGQHKLSIDLKDEGIRSPYPIKEWIFIFQREGQSDRFSYTVPVRMSRMWLDLDDYEYHLFRNSSSDLEGKFRWKNMYDRYPCISTKPIYTFPFSLFSHKSQPSGSIDLTAFRKKFLHIEFQAPIPEPYRVTVFETRYPLLHLRDGSIGLHRI